MPALIQAESPKAVCTHRTHKSTNSKRVIVCCDGTWNDSNSGGSPASNVSRLSGAIAHKCCSGMPQLVFYRTGAGTEASFVAKQLGGIFGQGVVLDIVRCYRFICDNYNPGDEVILIGFSRGAFTARSVAALVCALGFLNRAGVDHLKDIFDDYCAWSKWDKYTAFDEKKHLAGFTLENKMRINKIRKVMQQPGAVLRTEDELAKELLAERKELFSKIVAANHDSEAIAKMYREMLVKHEMAAAKREAPGVYVPVEGRIRAVGVWDTVGSLGIPKTPILGNYRGRDASEIRFQHLDVHPNIEYAFHALALDETRMNFEPTMWGHKNNTTTQLRQVWFPGNHGNVGGGWPDQQMATISLAWMADQLTSIGVEFSKTEMARIFYRTHPGSDPRPWGLGKICAASGATALPDKIYNAATWPYSKLTGGDPESKPRTPGGYRADDGRSELEKPNELIHPSVRIRLAYGGLDLDDGRRWECRALKLNGYELTPQLVPSPGRETRDGRATDVRRPYYTVSGAALPFFDDADIIDEHGHAFRVEATEHCAQNDMPVPRHVKVEQPRDSDLHQCKPPAKYYVWKHKKTGKVLEEEHLGVWERMFVKVNERKLEWVTDKLAAKQKAHEEAEANRWSISKKLFGSSPNPQGEGKHELKDVIPWQTGSVRSKPNSPTSPLFTMQ